MPRLSWIVLAVLLGTGCRHQSAASGGFENIYPRAKAEARTTVQGRLGDLPVVVHATAPFDEDAARRFLLGLHDYRKEVDADVTLLREGVARHLGEELMARVDRTSVLKMPELPTEWYLLGGDWPGASLWSGPPGSTYHIVRGPADPLTPRSTMRYQVHSKTHHIIRSLGTERPAVWPRWLEEGLAEWNRLQFARLKDGRWDGDADVLARLTWQRGPVRERLMRWKNPTGGTFDPARFEPEWESDLLYKGALGAVLALDEELHGGAIGVVKELARALPDERDVLPAVEKQLGRPLHTVGRLTPEARRALHASLHSRARAGELPAASALGQFPEDAAAAAELLAAITRRGDPEAVIAGITGLRYLGDRRLLERTLRDVESRAGPDLRATLAEDNRWAMAWAYARSGREGDWYAGSAPVVHMGTGPGTVRPSSRPSTSPTR
ncbi:MAG TPA: hypothetical protein VFO11_00300 [Candidatus Polarisedimenticolaceae bacterium]|nr:hypothetical protein [Candidatus Polarisedimenticolaceae bacterium]